MRSRLYKVLLGLNSSMLRTAAEHRYYIPIINTKENQDIDSIIKENITFHTTHFEGSAAIMAGTIGRISGLAGISISIKGPGLANMIPGLAVCHFENFPLIAICESYEADVSNSKAHKRINHNSYY